MPGENDPDHKRKQYAADITYGTNNEFGFDYLRDNMAMSRARQTQRGHSYAIVDEVDSILIDEARTPLIISGRVADAAQLYYKFATIVRSLRPEEDYDVDEAKRTVSPTETGIEKVEQALGIDNLYDGVAQNLVHQLQAALRAKELFKRDKDYIINNGEVKIVDEFTGRILEGRRWSEGLHQAVEAKEGVKIKEENQTLATITLQNYFRMYDKLAGMTGTAVTEAAEFNSTYDLHVVPVPTNRPTARADEGDLIYKTEDGKFGAVVDDIAERYEAGQPVLVGTISVEKSEKLSRMLEKRGVTHEVLNAKQHTREAEIVAQAGRLQSVTVATNMAGRGVDIILGGNPEILAKRDLRAKEVDIESDEGRAELLALEAHYAEDTKIEGDKVRELGGLYVLGTERHESRRIDNQLRGRSGRQGDPGESRFYLSLEDDLMRLFATGAINWVMGKALPDDVPLEAKMVSKAIERAQTTVEQKNGEIRKNVLKYDEVMNAQRKVIYALRDQILDEADLRDKILGEHLPEAVEALVGTYCVADYHEEWDIDGLHADVLTYWPSALSKDQLVGEEHRRPLRAARRRRHHPLREARERARCRRHAPGRAPGDAQDHRHEVARAPLRDGLPPGGHQPPGDGPEGSAHRVAARGLRDVRPDDEGHRAGPREVRDARAGQRAGARSGAGGGDRLQLPRWQRSRGGRRRRRAASPEHAVLRARRSRRRAGWLRLPAGWRPKPVRSRPAAAAGGGRPARRHGAGGEVRVGQDAPQRTVPVRERQEVQALPRQGLRAGRARLLRRARSDAQAHRRRGGVPEGRGAARPTAASRDGGVPPRPVG